MKDRVEKALDLIRPALQNDGGNVELVDVDEAAGIVKVKLVGACGSCPMSQMTLRMGVERVLREEIPEVKEVVAVYKKDEFGVPEAFWIIRVEGFPVVVTMDTHGESIHDQVEAASEQALNRLLATP